MANYWVLKLKGGDEVSVKPSAVDAVNQAIQAHSPIPTSTRTIMIDQIISFEETDKPYVDKEQQKLLEGASQAFGTPVLEGDSVKAKWVKKTVPMKQYNQHYSKIPGYKLLNQSGDRATVMFVQPVHLIDYSVVSECTAAEVIKKGGL